jgi:hypothetical protein
VFFLSTASRKAGCGPTFGFTAFSETAPAKNQRQITEKSSAKKRKTTEKLAKNSLEKQSYTNNNNKLTSEKKY